MTGNQIKGKGFRGALRYNLEKVEKKMAEVLDHSFARVNEKSIMKEIQMVRVLRPNLQKFFYHTSINFPPHEDISNDLMNRIAHEYLRANGFAQHQFIFFRHYDANHPHLHILVNRVGYDGKVLSDSNDFARSEKILRELEKKYNLTQVIPSERATRRAPTNNELEMAKRTNVPSHKMRLQKIITDILHTHPGLTCSQFIKALQVNGIQPKFNIATTGYVSGISYGFQRLSFTGSKLGSDFKWTTLRNRINYDQNRDRAIIEKANESVPINASEKATSKIESPVDAHFRNYKDFRFQQQSLHHVIDTLIRADSEFEAIPENVLGLKRRKKRRRGLRMN